MPVEIKIRNTTTSPVIIILSEHSLDLIKINVGEGIELKTAEETFLQHEPEIEIYQTLGPGDLLIHIAESQRHCYVYNQDSQLISRCITTIGQTTYV
jgi:hypothetical protein